MANDIPALRVVLTRTSSNLHGTAGILTARKGDIVKSWYTLELPWLGNSPGVSCIPAGRYACRMTMSPKYRKMLYLVEAVPKRSGIRIHSANFAGSVKHGYKCDLLGCIALGKQFTRVGGQLALTSSRVAMREFERFTEGKSFTLEIVWEGAA